MKIAYITSRYPFPVEKGDKLRAYHQIKGLARQHDVYLFAITDEAVSDAQLEALGEVCSGIKTYRIPRLRRFVNTALAVANGLPMQVGYFRDSAAKQKLQADLANLQPDHVFAQLIRTSEYVKNIPCEKTLDYMDAFSFGAGQRSAADKLILRPIYGLERRLVKNYEQKIYAFFDHHIIISQQDRDRLPLPYPKSVRVVPNGVDTEAFSPVEHTYEYDVLFVGNMGYHPNVEAAEFLVRKIMPVVWKERPEAIVGLAGARPVRRIRALESRRVKVTGWVDDIRQCYASARVFVAPMFSGMGLQNKMLEAMSMQRPSVTTTIVNNAIGAVPGEHLAVGNSAPEFASQILKLLSHTRTADEMGIAARSFILERYDWASQNKLLVNLISSSEQIPEGVEL